MVTRNTADYANVPGLILADWLVHCNDRRNAYQRGNDLRAVVQTKAGREQRPVGLVATGLRRGPDRVSS
jgi:hypothetical protein